MGQFERMTKKENQMHFEKWIEVNNLKWDINKGCWGSYTNIETQKAWMAWDYRTRQLLGIDYLK